jgi:hypothetical protein
MARWRHVDTYRLTVRFEPSHGYWRVSGREGDYGITRSRREAIEIACDVTCTASHWMGPDLGTIPHGYRPIAVYREDGSLACVLTRVRGRASSQSFQDAVP